MSLVGRTIKQVRRMTKAELEREGWETGRHGPPLLIVLDDDTLLYPSRDPEGNGPGCLFGAYHAGGGMFTLDIEI